MESARIEAYLPKLEASFDNMVRVMTAATTAYQEVAPGPRMSMSQMIVLKALKARGPLQVTEVANELTVTLSAATGLVDRLVKAGFAERERDQRDRRVVWVRITPEGEQALEAAIQRRRAAFREMVKNLTEAELEQLCDILGRMG
ncbi:MarR family winged helix-turn-helix transcriptional regulator [Symbiobacterium thermophilum]|uniref:MarR family transcriptional regulator n=2 Tax=Symbiobacterium thermophilum TaxID=2734 RepID=Q67LN4_SYMTH|nr:MarR family transcriptional regulator [Symbiobacterium thermophilum]MBY6276906.1 MarR family transcriptional regulator [Symbiobacterium thermophilum]OTA41385.1 MAG: hypothetical protein A6D92_07240 [Symbiobacterium thermophilum]BAD41412.1 MarR family transcriptional regulator [Symbiobacterium thermophilum IAM 14863]